MCKEVNPHISIPTTFNLFKKLHRVSYLLLNLIQDGRYANHQLLQIGHI